MPKKYNCKHGLDNKQEIEARRLRVKLESGDKATLAKYHEMWEKWVHTHFRKFTEYLHLNYIVYYSAYVRACNNMGEDVIYGQIANYCEE